MLKIHFMKNSVILMVLYGLIQRKLKVDMSKTNMYNNERYVAKVDFNIILFNSSA